MASHPLTNFQMQKYYLNEPRFNGVYSRDNLPKRNFVECNSFGIKDEAYVTNLDEYSDIVTHWSDLYVQNNDVTCLDNFEVEHILKEFKTFIGNKNMKANIFRIKAYNSIMCRYYCTGFINYMLRRKTLTEFTNLFTTKNKNINK